MNDALAAAFKALAIRLDGSLHTDLPTRTLYATDASVYRKMPLAVALPRTVQDVVLLTQFAVAHKLPITARTAGTSLAGQAIGEGLVLDFSVHFTSILEINADEGWVRVQPGVIRDELNRVLAPMGLWFSPNTSTANRCMLGGMVANNSSGTTSIRYGVTRDKVLETKGVLGDGRIFHFKPITAAELDNSASWPESDLALGLVAMLSQNEVAEAITQGYPKRGIHRRNTGYALDVLLEMQPFKPQGQPFNLSKLLAGSEGTLALLTEIKLSLDPLPPSEVAVVCAHFGSVQEAMEATLTIMQHAPYACELMDKTILDCTRDNLEQAENRFFVEGDPGAILAVELRAERSEALQHAVGALLTDLQVKGYGYAFPLVYPPDIERVWTLRAAGLGLLSNVKGNAKPIAFVEDTAVDLPDLPAYIRDFENLMAGFGQKAVYYAHAGAGELHLRPVLDLKRKDGQEQFRAIAEASAKLVKAYAGSLSGEHGDGRARSEFIPEVLGERNMATMRAVKQLFDPQGLLNSGLIIDAVPMDRDLRYSVSQQPFTAGTFLDFSGKGNMLLAAEACNGSGDCRKLAATGATMCPSYQATRREQDSTRARANMLREVLTRPQNPAYPMGSEALHEVLGACLSCKACKRECPSSVDMALLKAEADYHYQRRNGYSLRTRFFGNFHRHAALAATFAPLSNMLLGNKTLQTVLKSRLGIAAQRSLPPFSSRKGSSLAAKLATRKDNAELLLYIDEFTQYQDAHLAQSTAKLLHGLGFTFEVLYAPSARACMSKAMLPEAKAVAAATRKALQVAVDRGLPIVGIEPSAVLGLRDDLPKLFSPVEQEHLWQPLAPLVHTIEEFLAKAADEGRITSSQFHTESREVHLHLHCHQKALSHVKFSKRVLSLPQNYQVTLIPSGCCGMAGSFGYEAEHYDLSMSIAELVLLPRVRSLPANALIAAAGTSCRHQIWDGAGKKATHPVEILLEAIR